jgi:WD40 repeat protein
VYNLATNTLSIGVGHTDAVLAVASSSSRKSNFVTCGKDQTVCYWSLKPEDQRVKLELVSWIFYPQL